MSTALDYAAPDAVRSKWLMPLRVALLCWAIPLCLGVGTFVLWLLTEAEALMVVGMFMLPVGAFAAFTGSVMLIFHVFGRLERARAPTRRRIAQAFGTGALLLSNFGVAYLIVLSVESIAFSYHVTVVNAGTRTLDSVVVNGPSCTAQLGPLAPGARHRVRLNVGGTGSVLFTATQAGATRSGTIDAYV